MSFDAMSSEAKRRPRAVCRSPDSDEVLDTEESDDEGEHPLNDLLDHAVRLEYLAHVLFAHLLVQHAHEQLTVLC